MTGQVFLVVMLAACLHAGWNAIVKGGDDKLAAMVAVVVGHAFAGARGPAVRVRSGPVRLPVARRGHRVALGLPAVGNALVTTILAFSDLHLDAAAAAALVAAADRAGVLVGGGDFGVEGEGCTRALAMLDAIDAPLVLVSGNHDSRSELENFCRDRPDRHLLHGSGVTVAGLRFAGIGGEIPRRGDAPWNETLSEAEAAALLDLAGTCDVLISHTPPLGHCDVQRDGAHEGSAAVARALERAAPTLCLCGHIHASWGATSRLGRTRIVNLGPAPRLFEIDGARRE